MNSVIYIGQYLMYSISFLLSLIFLKAFSKNIAEDQWYRSNIVLQTLLDK